MKKIISQAIAATLCVSIVAKAEPTRVMVNIENLAPDRATFQTPHWIGFHDGVFDIYNGNTPASTLPIPGSVGVERLAEDGNTVPLSEDFQQLVPDGVDATVAGPNGAIGPGETATISVILGSENPNQRYFSYASMVLPSNDFWYANGNPQTHPVFDENGNFIAQDFFVINEDILDAGTEVNDEIPENTAFFGQMAPNTGVDENGVILDFDPADPLTFFQRPGSGGILDAPDFAMADFLQNGYPFVKISFSAAPAITEALEFAAELDAAQEVPPVESRATGEAEYQLVEDGTHLQFWHEFRSLHSIVAAHLHLAPEGENGPVVASLLSSDFDPDSREGRRARRGFEGELTAADLTGPLAGQPLDALIGAIQDGEVYINIHSEDYPSGEIRGQLMQVAN